MKIFLSIIILLFFIQTGFGQTKKQLKIADKFSKTTEDSTFILHYSYVHMFSYEWERRLSREMELMDSVMLYNEPGKRIGPFENDSFYLWYKVKEIVYDTMFRVGNIWLNTKNKKTDSTVAKRIFEEAKNGASFDSLCHIHSGDNNSQFECDLGWAWYDVYVTEFSDAIRKNKGEEILLVKSVYGWHVVKIIVPPFINRKRVKTTPLALKKE